ncbi:MAG: type II toxin-antitoxin system VapC family toxin [Gammaproteobacteria bacterium]|nr:type II toxin-antitoxin system VapC family toxin [Gammaproteobacteria bacterium]
MKLLLDTCTFLWIISDDRALSDPARGAYADPANEIYLSAVSVWEIMVKHALGRLPLPEPPYRFIPNQRERHLVEGLPLDEESVLQLDKLPRLHKDSFDRMLVCQAIAHGLVVVTPDEAIRQYPLRTLW